MAGNSFGDYDHFGFKESTRPGPKSGWCRALPRAPRFVFSHFHLGALLLLRGSVIIPCYCATFKPTPSTANTAVLKRLSRSGKIPRDSGNNGTVLLPHSSTRLRKPPGFAEGAPHRFAQAGRSAARASATPKNVHSDPSFPCGTHFGKLATPVRVGSAF